MSDTPPDQIDTLLTKLQARVVEAEREHARDVARAEAAEAEHERALDALRKLGFDGVSAARDEIARVEAALLDEVRRVERELTGADPAPDPESADPDGVVVPLDRARG